mmetsp:Transcript_36828/g.46959  ORF Transcript_36828/g.46959 Transcript_36828/m.46959 type:complete len:184 (-) Transcript_36828:299-850(-)
MGNSSSTEEEEHHVKIDTGDFMKVKQTLDDTICEELREQLGFEENHALGNVKLLLMTIACLFALAAQFWPVEFPESRPILFVCCASYFVLSGVLQCILSFIEKDCIFQTKEGNGYPALRICTNFQRFQEYFEISVSEDVKDSPVSTSKIMIGNYFTAKGEYWEEGFAKEVSKALEKFKSKKFD